MSNNTTKRKYLIFLLISLIFIMIPIKSVKGISLNTYWPTTEWIEVTPEQQGIDSSSISALYDYIEGHELDVLLV